MGEGRCIRGWKREGLNFYCEMSTPRPPKFGVINLKLGVNKVLHCPQWIQFKYRNKIRVKLNKLRDFIWKLQVDERRRVCVDQCAD